MEGSYEHFVRDVLQNFEDRVISVQKKAQEQKKVNEIFCGELKTQLEEVKIQRDEAKNVEELLSAMTCLSVHCVYSMGPIKRYSCKLIDGHLKGHSFILTLDKNEKEYSYDPNDSPYQGSKKLTSDFSSKLCFPDHMLSRFLVNLLHITYK